MVITIVLVALAAISLWLGGYLVGAGRGWRAREALRERLEAARSAAVPPPPPLPSSAAPPPLPQQQAIDVTAIREAVRQEFARHPIAPAAPSLDVSALREAIRKELPPPDRSPDALGEALARLPIGAGSRGGLTQVLDAIAERGGFATVLLSDEVGLPLAASGGAGEVDSLAGVSSLLLTLADRVNDIGAPTPIAVTVQDQANRVILHRIFRVAGERYLLTAVAHGRHVAPTMLDPALGRIERLLAAAPVGADEARS